MQIKKQTIFYKNLIFFKVAFYSLGILACHISYPILNSKLKNDNFKFKTLIQEINRLNNKISTLNKIEADNNLLSQAEFLFQNINSRPKDYTCVINNKLRQEYSKFNQKYKLLIPIQINFISSNILPPQAYYNKRLSIKETTVHLKFKTDNFNNFINLIEEAQQYLPEHSGILTFEANKHDIINPSTVAIAQDTGSSPIFISSKVRMRFQEIINQKK